MNKPGSGPHLLLLSAVDEEALMQRAGRLAEYLSAGEAAPSLADLCYSAAFGMVGERCRLALVARDTEQVATRLAKFAQRGKAPGAATGCGSAAEGSERTIFLFTGQGSQYTGMGRELYQREAVYRDAVDRCVEVLDQELEEKLLDVLFAEDEQRAALVNQTAYTQPALFVLEHALAQLFSSWGIEPDGVLGHSIGEYAAAVAAGVMDLESALRIVVKRGALMQALPSGGKMAAIFADEAQVAPLLAGQQERLSLAAANGPTNTVISGEGAALDALCTTLDAREIEYRKLVVSHAFHSPLMDPMLDEFEQFVGGFELRPPALPLYSNVSGKLAGDEVARPRYWRDHVRGAVRYADCVLAATSEGQGVLLEVGPQPVLLGMAQPLLEEREQWISAPSLRRGKPERASALGAAARYVVRGKALNWEALGLEGAQRVDLPL